MAGNSTALVTGGAQRLGRALALSLARQGWDIAVHYRASKQPALELARQISGMGRKAVTVYADLSDASEVAGIFPALAAQGFVPDCLINNAAAFEKDTLAGLAGKSFDAHMHVNLLAPLLLTRDFAAYYKGKAGNIINITDGISGWSMSPAFLSYALSKHGLAQATRMLARALAPAIRVNVIAPGATLPGKQDRHDTFEKLKAVIPMGQVSSEEEVCGALQYILSSPSLTGQILRLSGGAELP